MPRAKGLGRGLSALVGEGTLGAMIRSGSEEDHWVESIPVDQIEPNPFQPRQEFSPEELAGLADSLRRHGMLQPVLVRPVSDGHYQLVAGERRVRAARLAGVERVPARVRATTDAEMMAIAVVENVQRSDLNPLEEAEAYRRLQDELGWTQEAIAATVGKARSHVANYLRLTRLEDEIQDLIRRSELTMAHAKILLSVEPDVRRLGMARRAAAEAWTVKELERRAKDGPAAPATIRRDVHMEAVEEALRRALGARVVVRGDGRHGRIEIRYASLEELERLMAMLGGSAPSLTDLPV